ncbi:DNA helicase MCM9 isoform X2 [Hyalella azteca]|uniref:DNA helicase MCM9 n=1 Tax=Hyalella azteca TaxID=294128 RepID=A0A979FM57_HYAAZ|nr:DNA helicase MCM9 isoform X2 [Hyalella azteca]
MCYSLCSSDVFGSFLIDHHAADILLLMKSSSASTFYSIEINFMPLMQQHVEVAEALLSKPERLLPVLSDAIIQVQKDLLLVLKAANDHASASPERTALMTKHGLRDVDVEILDVKKDVHPRLVGVPCPAETRVPRSADIGSLLSFSGTVVRVTAPRLLRHTLLYTCDACKHPVEVKGDHDQYYAASKPLHCTNPHINCYSKNFSSAVLPDAQHTIDYQEVKLQEPTSSGAGGAGNSLPQSVWVTLHYDLVDSCKPGDDVLVCGTVVRRWRPVARDARPSVEVVIKANNVTVRNKHEGNAAIKPEQEAEFQEFWSRYKHKPLCGRDVLLASVCPQIYGLYLVKLAVAVVLCGGVQRVCGGGGNRVRGEPHLLLVGDPGTGKSQLLSWACSAGSRSVFTTGVGSSAAGLTVAAVKEPGGDWGLEAGALVLADGGLCCIDEFSSVREADRAAIHEAMEQQTISVAKAGMVCKLNTRCSVVAATNPKGRYDLSVPLNLNVGVASPLLSRFDLILVLLDTENANWDKLVSSYILSEGALGRFPADAVVSSGLWSLDKMRTYFRYVRKLQPKLSAAADEILSHFYQLQRRSAGRDQSRTTIRLLESLVRLSQGHARLMLRDTVTTEDAVVAVGLWEAAAATPAALYAVFGDQQPRNPTSTLHSGFPLEPIMHYREQAKSLLLRLGLEEVWHEESNRLDEEDRLASEDVLAEILKAADAPEKHTTITTTAECLPADTVSNTQRGSNSFSLRPGRHVPHSQNPEFSSVQASRNSAFIACATQDARRRDVIEELEDVPLFSTALVTNKKPSARQKTKKKVKRKQKSPSESISKCFTKLKTSRTRKQRQERSEEKMCIEISSASSNHASSTESDSEIDIPCVGDDSLFGVESAKSELHKNSESIADARKSAGSVNNVEEIGNVAPNVCGGKKDNAVISNGSLVEPNTLSNEISSKRKQSEESPFCVNSNFKKSRQVRGKKVSLSKENFNNRTIEDSNGWTPNDRKTTHCTIRPEYEHRVTVPGGVPGDNSSGNSNFMKTKASDVKSDEKFAARDDRKIIAQETCDIRLTASPDVVQGISNDSLHLCDREPQNTKPVNLDRSTSLDSVSLSQKARSFLRKFSFSHKVKCSGIGSTLVTIAAAAADKNITPEANPISEEVTKKKMPAVGGGQISAGPGRSVEMDHSTPDFEVSSDSDMKSSSCGDAGEENATHTSRQKLRCKLVAVSRSSASSNSISAKLKRFAFIPKDLVDDPVNSLPCDQATEKLELIKSSSPCAKKLVEKSKVEDVKITAGFSRCKSFNKFASSQDLDDDFNF